MHAEEHGHIGGTELRIDSTSRPSSSGSDDSRNDDGRQDSPMTSIDEEARMRPQIPQRKVSNKIQELVELRMVCETSSMAAVHIGLG